MHKNEIKLETQVILSLPGRSIRGKSNDILNKAKCSVITDNANRRGLNVFDTR